LTDSAGHASVCADIAGGRTSRPAFEACRERISETDAAAKNTVCKATCCRNGTLRRIGYRHNETDLNSLGPEQCRKSANAGGRKWDFTTRDIPVKYSEDMLR
jgi:hypothetical protein